MIAHQRDARAVEMPAYIGGIGFGAKLKLVVPAMDGVVEVAGKAHDGVERGHEKAPAVRVVVHIKGFPDEDGNVLMSDYFDRPDRQGITWSIQVQGENYFLLDWASKITLWDVAGFATKGGIGEYAMSDIFVTAWLDKGAALWVNDLASNTSCVSHLLVTLGIGPSGSRPN